MGAEMRILCVTGYYKPAHVYGGPVRSVAALCESLTRMGAMVTVMTTNADGPGRCLAVPTGHEVTVDGVQVVYHPVMWPLARWLPFYSPALRQGCRTHVAGYDVVYLPATWTYAMWAGANAARRAGVPYIVSPRGSFMHWSMTQKSLKKRLYLALIERRLTNHAAAIHLTSDMERAQQQRWAFKPPVAVIPNGLDVRRFQTLPPRGAFRQRLGIPTDAPAALFVGRLHQEKRIDLLIEAFTLIARDVANSHLLLIGPDQDGSGERAKTQAHRAGLADRIHFTGLLTGADLMQAYADADLLLLLSHRENFGMVVVEAMAAGLPVLLSEDVGLAAEVKTAKAGFVVPAQADRVAEAWRRLLVDPSLRHRMGAAGQQLAKKQFAADVVATRMLEFFTSIIAREPDKQPEST